LLIIWVGVLALFNGIERLRSGKIIAPRRPR
jgi:hypothetical protein